MPSKVKKELLFLLPGIDVAALISKYYPLDTKHNITETPVEVEDYTTLELLHEKTKGSYMFIDSHKHKIKNWVNMWDFQQNQSIPRYTTKKCWWHKDTFNTHPIGCPVLYRPNITHGEKKIAFDKKMEENNITCETNDYFETEGIFCSFPCVKSYIMEMCKKNSGNKYHESCTLLTLLYYKIFGTIIDIPPAGTWKVLKDWGGHLTNDEYIQTLGKLTYKETTNIRRPYMYCSSAYIKEMRI